MAGGGSLGHLVAAITVTSVAAIGQYWGNYDRTCLNDWSKVSPIMRDNADDVFFRVIVWIHALVFVVFMVIYPIQWLRPKPVDGTRNKDGHVALGNVIKFCILIQIVTGIILCICRLTSVPAAPSAENPCVRRQIPTEVQYRSVLAFAFALTAQCLHAWVTRGGREWAKPVCQGASAISLLYHCFAIPTLIHMAFNYEDKNRTANYNSYTREMAAETVCIIFPLPAFDAINIFILHRRFALFDPNKAGPEQARHAWVQHHKYEMMVVCIMLLFVLPGMWVAHDAYWFFSTPGIENWLIRFAIQAAMPYTYLLYPKNLRFLLTYIFCESTSRLSDQQTQTMIEKTTPDERKASL